MSVGAHILRRLASAGLNAAQVAEVVAIFDEEDEARRAAKRDGNRERQARRRHASSRVTERDQPHVTRDDPSPKEKSPKPPKEITPSRRSEPYGSSPETAGERTQLDELREVLDDEHADALNAHRKLKGGKSWTPNAARLLAKEIAKVRGEGFDPNDAAETIIRNNWQGFEAPWFLKGKASLRVVHNDSRAPPPSHKRDRMKAELRGETYDVEPFEDYRTIDGTAHRSR